MRRKLADCPEHVKDNWPIDQRRAEGKMQRMVKSSSFRTKMLEALAASDMSVAELSRRSGVSYDAINKVKRREGASTSAENAKAIAKTLGFGWDTAEGPVTPDAEPAALVPVYDVQAAAGAGMVVDEYEAIAANLAFPPNYLRHITKTHPAKLAIISVTGGSMLPTLAHDDIVMVDTTKTNTAFDGIFVVRVDGLLKVKRVRKSQQPGCITLKSDNPSYPDEDIGLHDFEVIGRVVWMGTKAL